VLREAFDGIFNACFFKTKKTLSKIQKLENVGRIKNVKKTFFTSML